jgi:hypothetical protein
MQCYNEKAVGSDMPVRQEVGVVIGKGHWGFDVLGPVLDAPATCAENLRIGLSTASARVSHELVLFMLLYRSHLAIVQGPSSGALFDLIEGIAARTVAVVPAPGRRLDCTRTTDRHCSLDEEDSA